MAALLDSQNNHWLQVNETIHASAPWEHNNNQYCHNNEHHQHNRTQYTTEISVATAVVSIIGASERNTKAISVVIAVVSIISTSEHNTKAVCSTYDQWQWQPLNAQPPSSTVPTQGGESCSCILVMLPVQVMPGLSFLPQSSLAGIVELVVVVLSTVVDAPVANTTWL